MRGVEKQAVRHTFKSVIRHAFETGVRHTIKIGVSEVERQALLQFKADLNYSSHSHPYTNLSSWENGGDRCLWDGISCHNTTRHVVNLELQGDDFFGMDAGVISESLCTLTSLSTIILSRLGLKGTLLPCFTNLSSLTLLDLSYNMLSGSIPLSSSLAVLYLAHNILEGETVLTTICMLSNVSDVDLSGNQLNGSLPSCLGNLSSLTQLDLSYNWLTGNILLSSSLAVLHLSSNNLEGETVLSSLCMLSNLTEVDLSDNQLNGSLPSCLGNLSSLTELHLFNNRLSGIIPMSSSLAGLDLTNNNLKGETVLTTICMLSNLSDVDLSGNQLNGSLPSCLGSTDTEQPSGSFPPSLSNCTVLYLLDVGQNFFKGHIPKSIGNLSELKVLAMRKNNFEGNIPAEIGQLKNLQILDLSSNLLSGLVPNIIFNLQAMLVETHEEFSEVLLPMELQTFKIYYMYKNGLTMYSKGRDEHYTYIFPTMKVIDLSSNQLNGVLPSDLGKLKGLKLLNLSMNNFSGAILNSIVQLTWLESLDISTNHFSGQIPPDLGSLSYLGALNFSNNHLSGSIPQGGHMATFNESSYSGNIDLWGCPLPKKCSWPEFATSPPPISTSINEEEKSEESVGYDIGVGLSYVAGFTAVLEDDLMPTNSASCNVERYLVAQVKEKDERVIASGFSHHMTGDKNKFVSLEKYEGGVVRFGDDKVGIIHSRGSISLDDSGCPSVTPVTLAPPVGDGFGWPSTTTSKFPHLAWEISPPRREKGEVEKDPNDGWSMLDPTPDLADVWGKKDDPDPPPSATFALVA
ncbi:receptor-like protein 43 [Cryptomeria japonica]|uniref:receptor-like protein 43 n=1 Tax=Cryptomeria japonica TaxID=3369 RepID=UPI0027DA4F03|nr:receptor-like protein 43 [Cryptomeria japonica]